MEPRSIQEGIEKAMKKWKAPRWPQDANRSLRSVATPGVQSPGEGVGGGVSFTSALRVMVLIPTRLAPHSWRADP